MAENKGIQHIAELGFDVSAVHQQLQDVENTVLKHSTKISDILSDGYKINLDNLGFANELKKEFKELADAGIASSKEFTDKVGSGWQTARQHMRDIGGPGSRLVDYFKSDGEKMAVQWTDSFEEHFAEFDFKKAMSPYIKWDDGGMHPSALTGELSELFPEFTGDFAYEDTWSKIFEYVQSYQSQMRDLQENGVNHEMQAWAKANNMIGETTESAREYSAVARQISELSQTAGKDGFSIGDLRELASSIESSVGGAEKVKLSFDGAKESMVATLNYTDNLGNKFTETWEQAQKISDTAFEIEKGFVRTNVTVEQNEATTRRLADQYDRLYQSTEKQADSLQRYYKETGDSDSARTMESYRKIMSDISKSSEQIGKNEISRLQGLRSILDNLQKQADIERERKREIDSQLKSEREIYNTQRQVASVQETIRKSGIDNSALKERAEILRNDTNELVEQLRLKETIDAQDRANIETLKQRSYLLQQETQTARYDSGGTIDDPNKGGILARGAKWFSAYQMFHLAKQTGKETVDTIKDVETAMMRIGRVLDLTAQQSDRARDSLFSISEGMGRDFNESAEIMLRFAQSGYDVSESLEMTEKSLLAMNTAELDAQNSTHSLVGILKQWGYETDQLITVIDKLNYTADNNAITTQDLVDGLLRASSAAKNAKFDFDDTVGALVALREASGRTGKELGTALNSMIAYTTRDKSLEAFESLGIQVWADEAKTEMLSVMDIWEQLSNMYTSTGEGMVNSLIQQTDMTTLYTDEVSQLTGQTEEYNQIMELSKKNFDEMNDAERKLMTEQFGTYRRNYMIAMLENFEKIAEVSGDMENSIGHSMAENDRYMETLEAKTKQLVASLKELAVQAGEAGLMDMAKGAVSAATALTNLTVDIGGINKVLISFTGLLAIIKREKIAGGIENIASKVEAAQASLRALKKDADEAGGMFKLLSNEMKGMELTAGGVVGAFGATIMAVSAVSSAVNKYRAEQIRSAEETISTFKQMEDGTQSLRELSDEYKNLSSITERTSEEDLRYAELQDNISQAIESRKESLGELEGATGDYSDSLAAMIELEKEYYDVSLAVAIKEGENRAEAMRKGDFWGKGMYDSSLAYDPTGTTGGLELVNDLKDLEGAYEMVESALSEYMSREGEFMAPKDTASLMEYYYALVDVRKELYDTFGEDFANTHLSFDLFNRAIGTTEDLLGELPELLVAQQAGWYETRNGIIDTKEEYDNLLEYLYEYFNATEQQKADIENVTSGMYHYSESTRETAIATNEAEQALAEWNDTAGYSAEEMDNLVSEINTLESAMQSLAEGEGLSLDAMLDLVDKYPALAESIHWVGDEAYFSAAALEFERQILYANRAEKEAMNVASILAASGNKVMEQAAIDLSAEMINATSAEEQFAIMARFVNSEAINAAGGIVGMAGAVARLKLALGAAGTPDFDIDMSKFYSSIPQVTGGGGGGGGSRGDSENQKRIKELQKLQKEEQKAFNDNKKQQNESIKNMERFNKNAIDALKEQQKAAQERYKAQKDAAKESYDEEIKYLRSLKEESQESDAREDYEKSRNELLQEREEQEKRTSRSASERIREVDKALEELDRKEERRTRNLSIDQQIEKEKERYDEKIKGIDSAWEVDKRSYEDEIERIQLLIDQEKRRVEILQDQEQKAWDKRKEWFDTELERLREIEETARGSAGGSAGSFGVAFRDIKNDADALGEGVDKAFEGIEESAEDTTTKVARAFRNTFSGIFDMMDRLNDKYDSTKRKVERPVRFLPGGGTDMMDFQQSHTGSVITRDGLVNLQRGEIVVREDISRGLIRVAEFMDRSFGIMNSPQPAFNTGYQQQPSQIVFNAPLVNVERQEVKDKASGRQQNQELTEMLKRELDKFPK